MNSIARKLKKLRKGRGLSQEAVIRNSGISTGYYSQLESGEKDNPSLKALIKLSKAFRMSLLELMDALEIVDVPEKTVSVDGLDDKNVDVIKKNVEILKEIQEKEKRSSA